MEEGGLGACLFFLLRLSTDTFAALSSAACWSTLVSGGEEVEKVEELRWMRNCSAMSLSSFLGKVDFLIFFGSENFSQLLPGKEEVKVTLKILGCVFKVQMSECHLNAPVQPSYVCGGSQV